MAHSNGIEGKTFGRLTVIRRVGSKKGNRQSRALWLCTCECGGEKVVSTRDLTSGHVRSCGCLLDESRRMPKLGQRYNNLNTEITESHRHLRSIWKGIIQRCLNPNHPEYGRYGGRGITVCKEWIGNSRSFIKWGLENGYEIGLSVDRVDNDGNYEPSNCTFISRSENAKKKRTSLYLTAEGKTMTLCEWSRYLNRSIGYLGYWAKKYGLGRAEEVLLNDLKLIQNAQ